MNIILSQTYVLLAISNYVPKEHYTTYIKVFNNDGNNYSIKDGNFHKKSEKNNNDRSSKQTEGRGMLRKSRVPQYEKGPEWGSDKHWDNFESREITETFPFLF